MKVFKFGGASVKDAAAVKNVAQILKLFPDQKLIVVISAMGKTTNALELVVKALWERNEAEFNSQLKQLEEFHLEIMNQLFSSTQASVYADITIVFENLRSKYCENVPDNFDFEYDQIVSIGEVISTKIVAAYLVQEGYTAKWTDARMLIRTDHNYREGGVDWKKTEELIQQALVKNEEANSILITQGFVGHTSEGFTTTLGREGSDYTAGIFAFCSNAESVTIWKDVPGMLNADPKWFDNTIKLDRISFKEAIELSYYGASVIHPKTVKPLQNKGIPLYVKSFIDPKADGTVIQGSMDYDHLVPSFIFKLKQLLFSFTPKDFSFIVEENLSDIFSRLSKMKAKINLMQNSALSFSVLVDEEKIDPQLIHDTFADQYDVFYNADLELITIRHYDQATIDRVTQGKEIIVEQRTRQTARLVVRPL